MKKKLSIIFISLCFLLTACNNFKDDTQVNQAKTDSSSNIEHSSVVDSSSIVDNSSVVDSSSQNNEAGDLFEIVFLGYSTLGDGKTLSSIYLTDDKIANLQTVTHDGDEVYLIAPTSNDVKVEIYDFDELDEIGGIGEMLYSSENGNSILLQCNVSDILANVVIRFERGEEVISYSPRISLENGKIILADGVSELKKLETVSPDDDYLKKITQYIGEDNVKGKAFMRAENQIIQGQDCAVFKMGTNTETHFTTENWYAVAPDGKVYLYDVVMDEWHNCK